MLPEVAALHRSSSIVRIPPSQDVPMSDRVRKILDSSPLRRLASISQLGMVALVYPGATHSRLEHTLGVYHNALKLLARFSSDDTEQSFFTVGEAEAFLLATMLHDVGHWQTWYVAKSELNCVQSDSPSRRFVHSIRW